MNTFLKFASMNNSAANYEVSHFMDFIEANFEEYNPKRFNKILHHGENTWGEIGTVAHTEIVIHSGAGIRRRFPPFGCKVNVSLWAGAALCNGADRFGPYLGGGKNESGYHA
jgi:hypothetical protein